MSKYKTIKAFGLQTRYWEYHPTYGYGCAECCNGDRCDEDCTAKYKGNRKGCPHCKGKGWIRVEDLDPVNTPISPELSQKVMDDAEAYSRINEVEYSQRSVNAAIAVATPHAVKWEQAKKALERIVDTYKVNIQEIEALLAIWKEEGKEGGANE